MHKSAKVEGKKTAFKADLNNLRLPRRLNIYTRQHSPKQISSTYVSILVIQLVRERP